MRILMVVHEMNRGGLENFIMNLYRTIDRERVQFDFISHVEKKCAFDDEIISLGGKIYHSPDYRVFNHFQYIKWWNDFFKEHKEYKIIHSNLDTTANIHLRVAKKYGLITIAHSHNTENGRGLKNIVKKTLKIGFNNCCDYKFACSDAAAIFLFGKKSKEAYVIKNGIITENFTYNPKIRSELRKEFLIPDNDIVIGTVGRIDKNKNQAFIIDILKNLNDKKINTTFVLAGDGPDKKSIIAKAKSTEINNKVLMLGVRKDINRILQVFDVFILPSFHEGLPVSAVEAQAAGLKCVLSDSITKETDASGLVKFIGLDKGAEYWADCIADFLPYERKDTSELIVKAGYDIENTSKWLSDFYLSVN